MELNKLKLDLKCTDIKSIMEDLKITLEIEDRDTVIYLDGKKIDEVDLQSITSSLAVSEIKYFLTFLYKLQFYQSQLAPLFL